ncbi:DUF6318 family protein [Paenarthrobacter nitroguajacolicus]|uniref:DUF6318 family protein n=1 Tax=Paenarthrobacter nitroguajacolicus TaxID=211146 RepID=UPI0028550482|nr:DUF6318 family protein [Paenarthrobacter nitroguajacolicus]MDR6640599.1 hypothetical protein [Paenarthrobacter nitroguajacolicus]
MVWLLTGCSTPGSAPSETSTTTAPPASSASAATPSATPSAPGAYKPADAHGKAQNVPVPVMPELAKENSEAGLEAFIGYWYAQLSYVDETGDLSAWLPLNSPNCRLCVQLQKSGEDAYINGRWIAGGRITVPVVNVQWSADDVHASTVQVIQERIDYYNADGSIGRARSEASNDAFAFFAKHIEGAWTVVDLGVVA